MKHIKRQTIKNFQYYLLYYKISLKNNEFQEHFILLGGLPLIISYAEMQYEHKIRYLASFIIQTICKNTKSVTFQTFISCRGLPALVALLGGDYSENKDLIFMTIDSIYDIFELQVLLVLIF